LKKIINLNKHNLIIFFLGLLSFIGSIYQGSYIYDGFHWGLVGSNAQDFLNGKKPYGDFFVHYGFLTVLLQSLALKIYNSIFSILVLSSLVYSISLILLAKLTEKFFSNNYVYLLIFIIFFMQPFIVFPWHTYFIFLISLISIFLFIQKKNYSLFLFGSCLQIGFLFSESYKIFSILIIIFSILIIFFEKKNFKTQYKKMIFIIFGYLSPLAIFYIYLKFNNLIPLWKMHSKIPDIFINQMNTNLIDLVINFFTTYLYGSLNIFSSSFFSLGLLINLACILFVILFLLNRHKNLDLLFISIFSLLLNFMLVFRHESFRFFCGPIIGIIILFFFIKNLKNDFFKYCAVILIIFIATISNPFEKSSANKNFTNKSVKINSYKSNDIDKFRYMRFKKDTWNHYDKLNKLLIEIAKSCNDIEYFYNATSDHYYYFLTSDYLDSIQKVPGYSESILKNYYDSINNIFDASLENKINQNIEQEKIILIRENLNTNYIKINNTKIKLKNYYHFELPFSYNNKKKLIDIPKTCVLDQFISDKKS